MNLIPKKMSQLRRIALAVLLASFAILETPTISAQELGKTITSPFGIARQTSALESGTDGDTFVDPETGEVGHIIRNPFGVANPEGVDTGIDIPDDAGEEVGGIITSPFGVPDPDGVDTGMDVIDEDEEYLISLPDDEESDAEDAEDVDEVDDKTSDEVKEIEDESEETAIEKYVPVIDNPMRGVEFDSISLAGTSTYTVESETNDINNAPTLYVHAGGYFTLTLVTNLNLPTNIQPIFRKLNQSGTQNPFEPIQSGSNPPYCFVYHVPSAMYEGTYSASISCTFNGVQIERVLKIEIVYFEIKIDYSGNGAIDDDDVYDANNPFGKLIHINNLDVDQDGIPDYADGFVCNGYINGIGNQPIAISDIPQNTDGASLPFEKIIIRLSKNLCPHKWKLNLNFNQSSLDVIINRSISSTFQTYEPCRNGTIRLWKKNGDKARTSSDYISSNEDISFISGLDGEEKEHFFEYTIYVEAINPCNKDAIEGETINARLNILNTQFHFDDSIVLTPYQIVFEGITSDMLSVGTHSIYFNPCGIEENGYGRFHFETIPSAVPCTNVKWRADKLRFIGGADTGKSVTVQPTGDAGKEFSLNIDIGRSDKYNPSIKGKILKEKIVKLYIWIVADNLAGSNSVFDQPTVRQWVAKTNEIFMQAGMRFEIPTGGINYVPYATYKDIDSVPEGEALVEYPQTSNFTREDGLEIFFVNKIANVAGLSYPQKGIIVSKVLEVPITLEDDSVTTTEYSTRFLTLAHELGHACGLEDIYPDSFWKLNVNSLWMKKDCTYKKIPDSIMSVPGYYNYYLMHENLIERLLMYGASINDSYVFFDKYDISSGKVYGNDKTGRSRDIKTGLEDMDRTPKHDR